MSTLVLLFWYSFIRDVFTVFKFHQLDGRPFFRKFRSICVSFTALLLLDSIQTPIFENNLKVIDQWFNSKFWSSGHQKIAVIYAPEYYDLDLLSSQDIFEAGISFTLDELKNFQQGVSSFSQANLGHIFSEWSLHFQINIGEAIQYNEALVKVFEYRYNRTHLDKDLSYCCYYWRSAWTINKSIISGETKVQCLKLEPSFNQTSDFANRPQWTNTKLDMALAYNLISALAYAIHVLIFARAIHVGREVVQNFV